MKFNLRGALFTSLALLTVARCPCCGSSICLNTLPILGGTFILGGLLPKGGGEKREQTPHRGARKGGE